MKGRIKIISYIIFTVILSDFLVQDFTTISINAEEVASDIDILSSTDILPECAKEWARRRGATKEFIDLADIYFKYSKEHGNVNPAIAYVQSALETGYGRFGSMFGADSHNPCGMKMTQGGGDYDPTIHMRFKTWDDGVKAHLDHLALYAGADGYPLSNTTDPRHFKELFGRCKTVKSLGGCYAPSATYGDSVLELYNSLVQVDKQYRGYVISNLPAVASIESIDTSDMLEKKTIKVSGFAIAGPGIKNIDLYIGGKFKSSFNSSINRQDVKIAYPLYNDENSGFSVEADVADLEAKEQEIKLIVHLNNGSSYEVSKNFILEKKPPLTAEQLEKIENSISIVLDDELYDCYNDYSVTGKIDSTHLLNIDMIEKIKSNLQSSRYNVVVVKKSIDNLSSYTNNVNTFKCRAKINIDNLTAADNNVYTADSNDISTKELSDKVYFLPKIINQSTTQLSDKYSEIADSITSDFISADDNIYKYRNNTFYIINSVIAGIKVEYNIDTKNTFNDKKEDQNLEFSRMPLLNANE